MILIKNKVIVGTVREILERIRYETSSRGDMYLKDIKPISNAVMVTCPYHKNHNESKPACGVFTAPYGKFKEGDFHCFACGETGSLAQLVGDCFGYNESFGEEWLIEKYGAVADIDRFELTDIEIPKKVLKKPVSLDKSVLEPFSHYDPYMWKRKLSKAVVDKFEIGYNPDTGYMVFPVWDMAGNLHSITQRSVINKRFQIQDSTEKPVYLLNHVVGKNYPFVIVCEAQLDALCAWTYGVPAVAMLGVGSAKQYEQLNKSGIRWFVTMFDNDLAGKKATDNFNRNIRKDAFVTNISFKGLKAKDINDLSKEEFDKLLNQENLTFRLESLD